ncbi:unnamed protein product [Rotaria sp. Silwood2]|nr:unnamed protein product [Rotaria sp. Silwood2]
MTATNNVNDLLTHIFTNLPKQQDNDENLNERRLFPQQLNDFGEYLDNKLNDIATPFPKSSFEYEENRIGPSTTNLNLYSATGIVQCTRFDYTGIGSFNTARADVCVFRGKWQYEVLLETRGVMQFGWCTIKCHFSQEIGVGDTWTSFSYDGGRIRKWNVQNSKYGDSWLAGDIISCLIDCDEGTISFKRNGVDLGIAFENVPCGKGVAYFPAISLSQNERIKINFGSRPFRHPTLNYLPIDEKPQLFIEQASFLFDIFEQVIYLGKYQKFNGSNKNTNSLKFSQIRTMSDPKNDAILMIIAQQIMERLCPLLIFFDRRSSSRISGQSSRQFINLLSISVNDSLYSLIDSLREYNESLTDIDNKLMNCRDDCPEIRDELLRSKKIFEQQTEDLTRKIAWITMHVFSHEKRRDIVILHRCVYRTLQIASEAGNLFSFVPEIYLNDIYLNTFTALNVYYPTEESGISREMAGDFVQFIANHMQDTRIVNSDVRDNMTQSLSAFCFYSGSLRALEGMREYNRTVLIRALLTPYANRPWAMTNLILVRFWKGCGFGFRYSQAYPSKFIQSLRKDRVQDSSPSIKYQQEIGRYLSNNIDDAIRFLNSLLGQLNWAFSEFMGLLKDLVPTKSRYMPTIEHRQMKICSTCFDVTVSLLRTIEMTICVAPIIMLDKHSTKSEMLLIRLLQLLGQIINRLATKNYVLEDIERLKMYALDNIQPYPIFSAVCGILVYLINRTSTETSSRACRAIYNEVDLDLSCLHRLIYDSDSDASNSASSSSSSSPHFTLISQPEINRSEAYDLDELYRKLNDTYQMLAKTTKKSDDNDESICIICYSHQIQAEFRPCKHQACLSCINMHFMTSKECFFCKTHVDQVVDLITGRVIDSIKPNENNTKDK